MSANGQNPLARRQNSLAGAEKSLALMAISLAHEEESLLGEPICRGGRALSLAAGAWNLSCETF